MKIFNNKLNIRHLKKFKLMFLFESYSLYIDQLSIFNRYFILYLHF